jgi:O-antigen/teichoic acid export membrane protein
MSRLSFFRQSAWLTMGIVGGGMVFGTLLQAVLGRTLGVKGHDYDTYSTLVQALTQLGIPLIGLQTAFAHLAARSDSAEHRAELSGAIRALFRNVGCLWVLLAIGCACFQSRLLARYQITSVELWLMVAAAFFSHTTPALFGILQGRQHFQRLGVAQVFNQLALFISISILVTWLHPTAAAAMAGYLIAMAAGFSFALFSTRAEWRTSPRPFALAGFVRRYLPLTLAVGSITFLSTQDMLAAKQFLNSDADIGPYSLAKNVARLVLLVTGPLVLVLFPKVIQSVARSEKTSVLAQAIGATGLISVCAALGCMFLAEVPLRIIAGALDPKTMATTASLLKHLTWAFIPLALANPLVSNLLARERFQAVYWLVAVAAGYGMTLRFHHPTFLSIAHTLAFFNTLFLLVAIVFTWRTSRGGVAEH